MSSDQSTSGEPREYYKNAFRSYQQALGEIIAKRNVVSRARGGVLGVWIMLFVLALNGYLSAQFSWACAGLAFLGFLCLAVWDERLGERAKVTGELAEIARIQLARLARNWKEVPEIDFSPPSEAADVSYDLDLFGHASLYQLICRAHTTRGMEVLRDWLVQGTERETLIRRNAAAAKLAPMRRFRESLDLQGRVLGASSAGPAAFVDWAESERWLEKRPWLTWTPRVLAVVFMGTIVLAMVGIVPEEWAVGICVATFIINLLLSVWLSGQVHDIFEKVDSRQHDVSHYRELLSLFADLPTDPVMLSELRSQMGADASRPQQALSRLSLIMKVAQMRHSPLFGLVHLVLQLVFLIDFHVLHLLERWHNEYGSEVRSWFDGLGELEAISSLASVVHDHPHWTFAGIDDLAQSVTATQLGHPLLPAPVCNDVSIGPKGTFLLVTGSNMSGKSTLLRAIGLNVALAQAGAPVNATQFALPPVTLATSMRIQDSLEDGISFFMAELKRLKGVVDDAERLRKEKRTQLFLLDEILQGTNSAERHIAVAEVVRRLTDNSAMGAISTHDLELAGNPALTEVCQTVHFKESFDERGKMTFDYRMHDGVATTSNALKLLELVGIRTG